MKLFRKKQNTKVEPVREVEEKRITPLKRMQFKKLIDSDEDALILVEEFKKNNPLCINFVDLSDTANNKMLAFLSGAVIALGGSIIELKPDVYIFVNSADFLDEDLRDFIEEKKAN